MATTWLGCSPCSKCGSLNNSNLICENCGYDEYKESKKRMISNLLKYGFKRHKNKFYEFYKKEKDIFYYHGVRASFVKHSAFPNLKIKLNNKVMIFNKHGNFNFFKINMDKLIGEKRLRDIKLEKILK